MTRLHKKHRKNAKTAFFLCESPLSRQSPLAWHLKGEDKYFNFIIRT